ncbi:unnamed protein product [Somion occarium]|uniref:MYND-type domain-containing protein n=2 Tax=Somion occarium TaxID=3059160 RepID=A0ABP1CNM7_9APHY
METMSEDPNIFHLTAVVYGSAPGDPQDDDAQIEAFGELPRRVEVKFKARIPDTGLLQDQARLDTWGQLYTHSVYADLKHSQDWRCAFCDKPARESSSSFASWMHLRPPRMNIFVHLLCDASGPCGEEARDAVLTLNASPPLRFGQTYPQAASCVSCQSEESAHSDLQRCSKCKLSRYCGVDCQRADWGRHKKLITTIIS